MTKLGLDASELYHMSRGQQLELIDQVTDKVLSNQDLGELARLLEQENTKSVPENALDNFARDSTMEVDTKSLVDELIGNGEKCTPENILEITKTPVGKIVWLETGTENAGFSHILSKHGAQFLQKGIPNDALPGYIITAVKEGTIVGYQGKKAPRAIYEFTYNGKTHRVAIQVASNGFIVGANPR